MNMIAIITTQIFVCTDSVFAPLMQILLGYITFTCGFYFKNRLAFIDKKNAPIIAGTMFFALFLLKKHGSIGFAGGTIPNVLFFIASSLLGFIFLYSLSVMIKNNKVIKLQNIVYTISESSLWILALHFLCFKIVSIIYVLLTNISINKIADFPVIEEAKYLWILYSLTGIMIPVVLYQMKGWIKNDIGSNGKL